MNEQNNASFPFHEMPEDYIKLKKEIKDESLKNLYSIFNFKYYFHKEDANSESHLYEYLKKINFIISKNSAAISKFQLIILCFEGHCLLIECIDEKSFKQFIKDNVSIFIDLDSTGNDISNVKKEVSSFSSHFEKKIESNLFLQQTIEPIAAYIIRRYFYPSKLFKDKSFFTYNQSEKETETKNFQEFNSQEMLNKIENDKKEIKSQEIFMKTGNDTKKINIFHKRDFIHLREIHQTEKSLFNLVIDVNRFYLFLIKKVDKVDIFKHEKEFVENYSNQYLTRFYGYYEEGGQNVGFVYEFMSNGTLDQYVSSNQENIDYFFSYMTILRIAQGIKYLHSNSLIHRDIKPPNILIDHDNIPYLSDFDTIRTIDGSNQEKTCDIGSNKYASPEQFSGSNYSYPTDIYSFGQLIYFLFEKEDNLKGVNALDLLNTIQNYQILAECKIPESIQKLFKSCISFEAEDRPAIDDVIKYLYEDANSFFYLHNPFIKTVVDHIDKQTTVQFFKEIYYLLFVNNEEKEDYLETHEIQLYLILNFIYKPQEISKVIYIAGKFYYDGKNTKQNFQIAKEYFDISAEMNNSESIYYIGQIYSLGQGVEQNYEKAKEYYERAAQQNHSSAMNEIGILYEEGLGVEQDFSKAAQYYESAIKLNNPFAFYRMAHLYQFGDGVEENIDKAVEYYEISAKQNVAESLLNLGFLYQTGEYLEINYEKSKKYYEKAAELGCAKAYTNLGFLYQFGQGVDQDFEKASEYFEIAASKNEPSAINNLGTIYFIEKNYPKAKEYFEKAANLKFSNSICNLGTLYKKGLGVPKDYLLAKRYFQESIDLAESLYQIGKLYYHGFGVDKDYKKAKHYFERAEEQKHPKSFYRIGMLYMNGYGVERDYEKSFQLFVKAAEENYQKANYQLGILHFYGLIQKHNYVRAREYFENSSENILDSKYYLGLIYEEGLGVKRDISKSIEYFEECSRNRIINYVSEPSKNPTDFQNLINKDDSLPYEISILNNKFYYHSNNELGFIYHFENNHDMSIKYFKEAGLNEYAIGQNSLGLYYQFYLNKKIESEHFYEKAIRNSKLALSEFNLGYMHEQEGKIEESNECYKKASEYENEPLIFKDKIYEDERLEKSKSFVICFTNLKLFSIYSNRDFVLKAIFRPLFLLIFHSKYYSYIFNFKAIQQENGIIITNLKEFILNNPLFRYQVELSESPNSTIFEWSTIKPKSESNLELTLSLIQTGQQNNNNNSNQQNNEIKYQLSKKEKHNFDPENDFSSPRVEEENTNFEFNQKIENIFEYMNKQNKFIFIKKEERSENNQEVNHEIVQIKMKGNNINRYFKYPKNLCGAIMNTFKNNENELIEIIDKMKAVIYTEPYSALFGRIGFENPKESTIIDINEEFYEGIGEVALP